MSVRTEAAEAAEMLRRVVAAIERGEIGCPPMVRARIEGAALAFDVVALGGDVDPSELLAAFRATESDEPSD